MKKSIIYSFLITKNFTKSVILLFSILLSSSAFGQTVYMDDFNRESLSPGGMPEVTYSIVNTGSGTTAYLLDQVRLRLTGAASGGTAGYQFVTAPLADFESPFNVVLGQNASDSIVWSFNMRYNYNGALSGFSAGNRGYAVILVADSDDLLTASGYAVVNGGESPTVGRYRLVKFTNGLSNNANITALVNGQTLSNVRDFVSLRVKYEPATNNWTFYDRSDGTLNWSDPAVFENYVEAGSIVDNSLTDKEFTHFGFLQSYPVSSISFVAVYDDFKVVASPLTSTSSASITGNKSYIHSAEGGFSVYAENAFVSIFDIMGKQLYAEILDGSIHFKAPHKGTYLIRLQTENGFEQHKHIVF